MIKDMLGAKRSISDIASAIGIRYRTIYYELQRKSHGENYDSYYIQSLYEQNSKCKVRENILSVPYLANYILKLLLQKHLSPENGEISYDRTRACF